MLDVILLIDSHIFEPVVGAKINHFQPGVQQLWHETHRDFMRQTAQGNVGQPGQLIKVQRLDLHLAASLELRENILYRPAFFRQCGQIGQLGLAVTKNDSYRFSPGVAAGSDYRNPYHIFHLLKK